MHNYLFEDNGREFVITSPTISEAIMESLMMVLDGKAERPMFRREVSDT